MTTTADKNDITTRPGAIAAIRKALRRRSGQTWSVKGDRGTAWGWIIISSPPKRRGQFDEMTEHDRKVLAAYLDLPEHFVSSQGVHVPASAAHRREYVARAEGRDYEVAETYWD